MADKTGPRLRANRAQQEALLGLFRQARIDAGLSQVDLARILSKPQSFVSKYESGTRRLDLLELRDVCRAMGISVVEFVRRFDKLVEPGTVGGLNPAPGVRAGTAPAIQPGGWCDNVTVFEVVFAKSPYIRARSKTFTDLASSFVTMSHPQCQQRLP
jgi:Helix-turn-helix